jgi:hypothetical protein
LYTIRSKSLKNRTQNPRMIHTRMATVIQEDMKFYKTHKTDRLNRINGEIIKLTQDSPAQRKTAATMRDDKSKIDIKNQLAF